MAPQLKKALNELRAALQKILGDNLIEVRLFGSRARGDAEPDSDVDVIIFVRKNTLKQRDAILDKTVDISLKHDLLIVPFVWSRYHLSRHRRLNTLLYRNIMNEGIVI